MSQQRKPNEALGCGCLAVVAVALFAVLGPTMCSGGSSTSSSADVTQADASPAESFPPITPEPVADRKREFLNDVDESISGAMIAGNPYKYVGKAVDLHCTVDSVVDEQTINAQCGEDADGMPAIIAVRTNGASQLDKGQSIRVLGDVEEPMDGVNSYGGERTFPTVEAEFME